MLWFEEVMALRLADNYKMKQSDAEALVQELMPEVRSNVQRIGGVHLNDISNEVAAIATLEFDDQLRSHRIPFNPESNKKQKNSKNDLKVLIRDAFSRAIQAVNSDSFLKIYFMKYQDKEMPYIRNLLALVKNATVQNSFRSGVSEIISQLQRYNDNPLNNKFCKNLSEILEKLPKLTEKSSQGVLPKGPSTNAAASAAQSSGAALTESPLQREFNRTNQNLSDVLLRVRASITQDIPIRTIETIKRFIIHKRDERFTELNNTLPNQIEGEKGSDLFTINKFKEELLRMKKKLEEIISKVPDQKTAPYGKTITNPIKALSEIEYALKTCDALNIHAVIIDPEEIASLNTMLGALTTDRYIMSLQDAQFSQVIKETQAVFSETSSSSELSQSADNASSPSPSTAPTSPLTSSSSPLFSPRSGDPKKGRDHGAVPPPDKTHSHEPK